MPRNAVYHLSVHFHKAQVEILMKIYAATKKSNIYVSYSASCRIDKTVKQDLSQGQDSSPDRALPITYKLKRKNFNILLMPMPLPMPGIVQ